LPEAQLDRFLLHILVEYPSESEEQSILQQTTGRSGDQAQAVMDAEDVLALQTLVRDVHVSADLMQWINQLVRASRPQHNAIEAVKQWVRWGAGPRAGQALVLCAKARALLQGRLAATREDVQALAMPVLRHRLLLNFAAEADGRSAQDVVSALLADVPYPA
jgi:MoxR-like ATPase